MNRRHFLSGTLGATVLGVSGCCTTAPPIEESAMALTVGEPLRPNRVTTKNRLTRKVIDPHCHLFNATDLQVAGYLRGPIAYSLPDNLRWIATGLATPIEFIAKNISISASAEYKDLKSLGEAGILDDSSKIAARIRAHREDIAERLITELYKSDYGQRMNEQLQTEYRALTRSAPKLDTAFLINAFEDGSRADRSADALAMYRNRGRNISGIFAFVGFMLSPRFYNLEEYKRGYTTDDDAFGVNRCFASLVDFDYWIGDCDHTRSSLRDQVLLMEQLSRLSGGYMTPLAAYNPWTDIEDDDASINLVMEAIDARGFAGVKIYPPIGYFPYGNARNKKYPAEGKHPRLELVDEKLAVLYEFCRDRDIPVMSHSSESLGRIPSHDILGGPIGWSAFFRDLTNANTRINLGHIGGSKDNSADSKNWTGQFASIMNEPAARFLYGDLGFWDDVVIGDEEAIERLTDLLELELSHGDTVADRLMFGTDWFMLAQTGAWSSYASEFQRALRSAGLPDATLDKLFYKNAERLFNA